MQQNLTSLCLLYMSIHARFIIICIANTDSEQKSDYVCGLALNLAGLD